MVIPFHSHNTLPGTKSYNPVSRYICWGPERFIPCSKSQRWIKIGPGFQARHLNSGITVYVEEKPHKDHFLPLMPQSQLDIHTSLLIPHNLCDEQNPSSLRRRNNNVGHSSNSKWPFRSRFFIAFQIFLLSLIKRMTTILFIFKFKYFSMEACKPLARPRLRAFSGRVLLHKPLPSNAPSPAFK